MAARKAKGRAIEKADNQLPQDGTAYYPRPPRVHAVSVWAVLAVKTAQLVFGITGGLATLYVMCGFETRDYMLYYQRAEFAAFVLICLAFVARYVDSNLGKPQ
jgi:hypothetical protein